MENDKPHHYYIAFTKRLYPDLVQVLLILFEYTEVELIFSTQFWVVICNQITVNV